MRVFWPRQNPTSVLSGLAINIRAPKKMAKTVSALEKRDQDFVVSQQFGYDEQAPHDGVTFADAVRYLWSGRVWICAVTFLGLALGLALITLSALRNPSIDTYRSAISLTMRGAKPGEYPNGTQFAASDLRSPAVLDQVYESAELASYGMKKDDFFKSVIVESYSPNVDSISKRFRLKSEAKNITPEEIRVLEENYQKELSAARSDGILVSFTVGGEYAIPASVGNTVVKAIPSAWSEIFIRSLGVTSFPVAKSDAQLVDVTLSEKLDYPLYFDYIDKSARDLDARLDDISKLPNANNLTLEGEKLTLLDLQRQAQAIRSFQIEKTMRPIIDEGLSKQPELTILAYENEAEIMKIGEAENARNSGSISALIRERNATEGNNFQDGTGQPAGAQLAGGQPSGMSTINNDVVDKIVALSISSVGAEFREGLLKEKLGIERNLAENSKQNGLIERRIEAIKRYVASKPANYDSFVKAFSESASLTITSLNQTWENSNKLLSMLNSQRLNEEKLIYSDIPVDQSKIEFRFYNSFALWVTLFGLTFLFLIFGILSYLISRFVRK